MWFLRGKIVVFFICLLSFNTSFAISIKNSVDLSASYALILKTANKPFSQKNIGRIFFSENHRLYSVRVKQKNKTFYQLRFGFFKTKKIAWQYKNRLSTFFDDAYVIKTKNKERKNSIKSEIILTQKQIISDYLIVPISKITTSDSINSNKKNANINYYALNLKTSNNLNEFSSLIKYPGIKNNAFYISELKIDGRIWYQYKLGFFINTNLAQEKLISLSKKFPLARIIRIDAAEKEAATTRIRSFFSNIPTKEKKQSLPPLKAIPEEQLAKLMEKGSRALSAKKYAKSIKIFLQILRYPENKYSMDTQEFLGFARELYGQTAYARAEYERYLSLYPESNGATRVRQRLASLLTARLNPKNKFRNVRRRVGDGKWRYFGSFSQFYRKDESTLNDEDTRENLSLFSSSINANARLRSRQYDLKARFIGNHDMDFTANNNDNKGSINTLYFDARDRKHSLSGKIGRQSSSKEGVLGRFDGLHASYRANDLLKFNITTGFVVENTEEGPNTNKFFKSFSTDLGTYANVWDVNVYYIQQDDKPLIGRQAIGSEVRYFHPQRTLFTLIDYDVLFKELNTLLAIGNWKFNNDTEMNATIDIRKTPSLSTSNALQGRTEQNIGELLNVMNAAQIRKLAADQTATSRSLIIGFNKNLSQKYQFNSNFTLNKTSTITIANDVIAGTGNEYFYNFQLVGNNIIVKNDTAIFGLRYSNTSTAKTTSVSTNFRFNISSKWRLNPRYRIDLRDNNDGTTQSINAINLKLNYRWKRHINFELDTGIEKSNKQLDVNTDKTNSYFLNMGYRYDF